MKEYQGHVKIQNGLVIIVLEYCGIVYTGFFMGFIYAINVLMSFNLDFNIFND